MKYEFYGGPLDGLVANISEGEWSDGDVVYVRLPAGRHGTILHYEPPKPYAAYRLGRPTPKKAQFIGEYLR